MKSLEELKEIFLLNAEEDLFIDRLMQFIPITELNEFGFTINYDNYNYIELNRENILTQLEKDVEAGFNYALNKNRFQSPFMTDVVAMWNYILEEGLEDLEEYDFFGLPIFKETAVKYGFKNPIGDDTGNEDYYMDNIIISQLTLDTNINDIFNESTLIDDDNLIYVIEDYSQEVINSGGEIFKHEKNIIATSEGYFLAFYASELNNYNHLFQ